MPLDRDHMTVASRIMVPTYVVFFTGLGLASLVTPLHRLLETPMLRYADHLMSIRAWGGLFVACGLVMLVALLQRRRMLYRWGLLVCGLSMAAWMLVAFVGLWFEPISYSAPLWPAFVVAACAASNRSLAKDTRDLRQEK